MSKQKVVPLKKKKNSPIIYYGVLVLFLTFIGISFLKNLLIQNFNPLDILTWQVIAEGVEGKGYFFRAEVPVYANNTGKIIYTLTWGKVRKGDIILEIKDNSSQRIIKLTAKASGVFTPGVDGLEFVGPDNIDNVDFKKIAQLYKPVKLAEEVEKGQPVGKLIDNLEKIILALPQNQTAQKFRPGRLYQIKIDGQITVSGEYLKNLGEYALFSIAFYPDEILKERISKVFVKTAEKGGFLVPKSSVKTFNGQTCIYTLKNEEVVLTPVKIIKKFEKDVLIEGETATKDELIGVKYLVRPFLIRPGDKLY